MFTSFKTSPGRRLPLSPVWGKKMFPAEATNGFVKRLNVLWLHPRSPDLVPTCRPESLFFLFFLFSLKYPDECEQPTVETFFFTSFFCLSNERFSYFATEFCASVLVLFLCVILLCFLARFVRFKCIFLVNAGSYFRCCGFARRRVTRPPAHRPCHICNIEL